MSLLAFLAGLAVGCGAGALAALSIAATAHCHAEREIERARLDAIELRRAVEAWRYAATQWRHAAHRAQTWAGLFAARDRDDAAAKGMLRTWDEIRALNETEETDR